MKNQEIKTLAKLLVKLHKSINADNRSLYGEDMDKALVCDLLVTLYSKCDDYSFISECVKAVQNDNPKFKENDGTLLPANAVNTAKEKAAEGTAYDKVMNSKVFC